MAKYNVGVPEGDELYGVIEAFEESLAILFPDGLDNLPDRDELFAKVQDGQPLTVRESLYARLFNEGFRIPEDNILLDPDYSNPDIVEKSNKVLRHFGVAKENAPTFEKNKGWHSQLKALAKADVLDSDFAETRKKNLAKGVEGTLNATNKAVPRFLEKKFAPMPEAVGRGGIFDAVLSDDGLRAITDGIKRIPDPDVREAVWAGIFGSRGTATANIALNKRIASMSGQRTQYFDPKTGILYGMKTGTRKSLPPTRTLDPLTTAILNNRWNNASSSGDIRIFKDVSSEQISEALREYVFNDEYFPDDEIMRLGRQPVGITDMRKLIASWMANRLGNAGLADSLLAHGGGDDIDELVSSVGRRYYLTIEDDPKKYGEFMERAVQAWMDEIGVDNYDDFSKSLGFPTVFHNSGVPQRKDFATIDSQPRVQTQNGPEDPKVADTVYVEKSEAEKASDEVLRISQNEAAAEEAGLRGSKAKGSRLEQDIQNLKLEQEKAELKESLPSKEDVKQSKALKAIENEGFGDVFSNAFKEFFGDIDTDKTIKAVAPLLKPTAVAGAVVSAAGTALDIEARESEAQQEIARGKDPLAARLQQGIEFGVSLTPPGMVKEVGEVAVEAGFEAAEEAATKEAEEKGLQDLSIQDRLLRSLTGF